MKKYFPLAFAFLSIGFNASAQMNVSGEVIEIIDAKTVMIAIPTGNVRAQLQYIDVPGDEHQLNPTVREHLRRLVLGKVVNYRARGIFKDRTVGRMLIGNVDVSQQMLRDGAAWHAADKTSQDKDDLERYASSEGEARREKRGVWAIAAIGQPPAGSPARIASIQSPPRIAPPVNTTRKLAAPPNPGQWGAKNPALGDLGALSNGYNAATKSGYIGTTLLGAPPTEADKLIDAKTAVDITYFYKEDAKNARNGVFVITVLSSANTARFAAKNDLYLIADEKTTLIGKAKRTSSASEGAVRESMTYTVKRTTIEQLANGNEVALKIGDYSCSPLPGLQFILYNLLQVSK